MRFVSSEYLGMRFSMTVCMAGETHQFRAAGPMARADLTTTQYWGGAFRYEKPDGSTLAEITRGMLGIDLPDFPEAGVYTLRAMEDGAQYICVTAGTKRTHKQRIDLAAGQQAVVQQGHVAVLDDGGPNLRLVVAESRSIHIDGPCRGLEVWV